LFFLKFCFNMFIDLDHTQDLSPTRYVQNSSLVKTDVLLSLRLIREWMTYSRVLFDYIGSD